MSLSLPILGPPESELLSLQYELTSAPYHKMKLPAAPQSGTSAIILADKPAMVQPDKSAIIAADKSSRGG